MLTTLDRLSLGRAVPDGSLVDDDMFAAFERDQIATRFGSGYTVQRVEGAWKDATTGQLIHEPTIVIEVAHDGSPEMLAAVRAVALAYKVIFRQDAVMRSTVPVSVDFI